MKPTENAPHAAGTRSASPEVVERGPVLERLGVAGEVLLRVRLVPLGKGRDLAREHPSNATGQGGGNDVFEVFQVLSNRIYGVRKTKQWRSELCLKTRKVVN